MTTTPEQADEAVRFLIQNNLASYIAHMEPDYLFTPNFTIPLIQALQDVEDGKCTRLIINAPPQHGKSKPSSIHLPAHFMSRFPNENCIITTYNQSTANRFGRKVRNQCESKQHAKAFPNFQISRDSNSVSRFANTQGGEYWASSPKGSMTGIGFKLICVDDPHKNQQEAESKQVLEGIHDWYENTLTPRLSPNGAIVIIHTRWSEDDLTGYLLKHKSHENWRHLVFPALSHDETQALFPQRYTVKDLLNRKASMGSRAFSAQYQQRALPLEGSIVRREWIKTYRELPPVKAWYWSWDTAIKAKEIHDFSVGMLWAVCENGYYLVKVFRQRVQYPELKKQVIIEYNGVKSREVLIEDKASGQQLIQELSRDSTMPIIGMMPAKDMPADKVARLNLVSPQFEAGKVHVPEAAPWVADVIEEWCSFPNSDHDDIVDATTQFLARVTQSVTPRIRTI